MWDVAHLPAYTHKGCGVDPGDALASARSYIFPYDRTVLIAGERDVVPELEIKDGQKFAVQTNSLVGGRVEHGDHAAPAAGMRL